MIGQLLDDQIRQFDARLERLETPSPEELGEGVFNLTETLILKRQAGIPVTPGTTAGKSTEPCFRGSQFRGEGREKTILRFSQDVKDYLIRTEPVTEQTRYWNQNSPGSLLQASLEDLAIYGQAIYSSFPSTDPPPTWDPTGQYHRNHPFRAHGVFSTSTGFNARRLRLFQIPGTGLILSAGGSESGHRGAFGIFDQGLWRLDDILVSFAQNGVQIDTTDSKARHIEICGMANDGIILNGHAVYLDNQTSHVQSCDRGLVVNGSGCNILGGYYEAARIAVHVTPTGHGATLNGTDSKNGTCYERNFLLEADTQLLGAQVNVQPVGYWNLPYKNGVAGVEIGEGRRCTVTGTIIVMRKPGSRTGLVNNSDGIICRGSRCLIDIDGGWVHTERNSGAFVRVESNKSESNQIRIRGEGPGTGGTVLVDLAKTNLHKANGQGTNIEIFWKPEHLPSLTPVLYPGGTRQYNLYEGTSVYINGKKQGT